MFRAGFVTGHDLRELARRYGIKPHRAEAILAAPAERRGAVAGLVGRSFLGAEAQQTYLDMVDDRIRDLAQ